MAERPRIPDAVIPMTFWLGLVAAIMLLAPGFVERANDRSPWGWWSLCPVPFLPFALFYWLDKTGRVELIDVEKYEDRQWDRGFATLFRAIPHRWRFKAWFFLTILASSSDLVESYFDWRHEKYTNRLVDAASTLSHPEYIAWLLIAAGVLGAAYEGYYLLRDGSGRG